MFINLPTSYNVFVTSKSILAVISELFGDMCKASKILSHIEGYFSS
jgi:hypothetical protein